MSCRKVEPHAPASGSHLGRPSPCPSVSGARRPAAVSCRDGGSLVSYDFAGRHFSERGVCDRDRGCDGVCTFDFIPECVACMLQPQHPHENQGADWPCESVDSPCNRRFLVPVGPKRRTGRLTRTFEQNGAGTFVLRCRPAPRSCHRAAATTTTLPGVLNVDGIWAFTASGIDSTCPTEMTRFVERSIRIVKSRGNLVTGCGAEWQSAAYYGAILGPDVVLQRGGGAQACPQGDPAFAVAATLTGTATAETSPDKLSLTQEWTFSPVSGNPCPPCNIKWNGTMTRVPASPYP